MAECHIPVFSHSNKRAFSIAEAMVTLLIVSVVMAVTAPIMSKKAKTASVDTGIPSGAVMFFNLERCPSGWTLVDEKFNGRFPRFAGNYRICNISGENANGDCAGGETASSVVTNNSPGLTNGDAIRNIYGSLKNHEQIYNGESGFVTMVGSHGTVARYHHGGGGGVFDTLQFDASRVVPVAQENRPKSITLLGCEKQ